MASDDDLQPLPPTLDDLHVPEKMQARCATCGDLHEAEAVAVTPLGEQADGAINVQISYRMPPCPNALVTVTFTDEPSATDAGGVGGRGKVEHRPAVSVEDRDADPEHPHGYHEVGDY